MESGRSIFTKKRLSDINAIDRDGKYEADKRRLLVDLWEERCGDDATYDAMITAMLKAGKMNEATNLCKLLQDTAHGKQVYCIIPAVYRLCIDIVILCVLQDLLHTSHPITHTALHH